MNLDDMLQQYSTRAARRALREQLTGPSRGWFRACREAVEAEAEDKLRPWLEKPDDTRRALLQALGPLAALHLRCAWVALRAQGLAGAARDCERPGQAEELLRAAWAAVRPEPGDREPDFPTLAGELLNLHWPSSFPPEPSTLADSAFRLLIPSLSHSPTLPFSHSLALARDLTWELLTGQGRRADRLVKVSVALVKRGPVDDEGEAAVLVLEKIPNGSGDIYPDARLCLVEMDGDFCQAPLGAREYLRSVGRWDETYDVRWSLRPWAADREEELLGATSWGGGSLGGAFGVGGWWLAEGESPDYRKVYFAAISAALRERGQLGRVTGKALKLDRLRSLPLRPVTHVLLHPLDKEAVGPVEGIEVVGVGTVEEAVEYIGEQARQAVRWHELKACQHLDLLGWKWVPLETHYQVLPLREVKRERLPREERREWGDGGLRGVDLVRWEEEVREERVIYEPVGLEEVFRDFRSAAREARSAVPRFVVLGPPGSGKTTLEQYLAWRAAKGDLGMGGFPPGGGGVRGGKQLLPARVRLREWEECAVRAVDPKKSLPEYLAERYQDLAPAPTAEQWRGWLRRGEVLLLLDGLDEIQGNSSFIAVLQTALTLFKDCPTVLTCRTVSFEQHRVVCPDFPVFTLAGLEDAQRDAYIRAFPAEHSDRYDPAVLIEQLNRTLPMRPLAANPLLLSILCFVVDDPGGVTLPATRGELYDQAVVKLLNRTRVDAAQAPLARKRRILERAALTLFAGMGNQRQLTFGEGSVLDALTIAAQQEGYRTDSAHVADVLLRDLTQNSGLLRGSPERGYFFLHPTFQEFLAAGALAGIIRARGWEAEIEIGGRKWRVEELIDKKAWDPRWQEVIVLLAGQLSSSPPPLHTLLSLLSDASKDDLFRHRLAVVVLCLPEIPHASRLTH